MTKIRKVSKLDCAGCVNDFYNYPNTVSSNGECWSLKSAELWKCKAVGIHDRPPWKVTDGKLMPKCYQHQDYVFVSPEKTC